jgi:hypothetical protein
VPSDPRSAPEPSDTDSDARQRAHDALRGAIVARPRPGSASGLPAELRVNLSLFTDALRAAGVPIDVGRGERPAHYGRPAAAERHRHGAASPCLSFAGDTAPFASGTRVRKSLAGATDIPAGLEGEVRQVFKQGGVWLADVQWDNGGTSTGIDCGCLELAGGVSAMARAVDELAAAAEADAEAANRRFARQFLTNSPPSMSGRLARGEKRPAWWGEPPAPGTRRKLIGDVLRVEDVLSESEIREFADAIELALIEVEGVGRDSDRYRDDVGAGAVARALDLLCTARETSGDRAEPRLNHAITAVHMVLEPPSDPAKEAELREPPRAEAARQYGNDPLDKPGYPPGLRHSERQLWDRTEDGIVLNVLSRLSRERAAAAAGERPLRIILADLGDGGGGPGDLRFVEVEDRDGKALDLPIVRSSTRPFYEIVLPALIGVAEDRGDGLSEGTGQRIARALETLTTSAGGALRELLDRTATDREAR